MTQEEIAKVLELHKRWLENTIGGARANLTGANLSGANLSGADLRLANLSGADLRLADLTGANLSGADLSGANLSGADLRLADLTGANLSGADLRLADLTGANLSGANLRGANLSGADLRLANLTGANLSGADLSGANLTGANLRGANLSEKDKDRLGIILEKSRIGYKKLANGSICKLRIPKGAVVFSINGQKCRTNKCTVISGEGVSFYDKSFEYRPGKKLEIMGFDLAYNVECSTGIHFFWTMEEAKEYRF